VAVVAVDDEDDARRLLERVLAGAGACVTPFANSADALAYLGSEPGKGARLLLSDIQMAEPDGLELIRELRRRGQQLPAIALTASAHPMDREAALAAGYDVHLHKPIDPSVLLRIAAELVTRGR
jgi:hypothetical protein